MIYLLILIIFFPNNVQGDPINPFGFKFQMLKGNDTNYRVEEIEREEDLTYPRNNDNIRAKVEEMWTNYYQCLENRVKEERKPELIRLLEGQFIEFECDICAKPFQDYRLIEWKYKPLNPEPQITDLEYLDLAPQMMFTPNKTLKIYNVIQDFEGVYACYYGKNVESVYILEVSKNDTVEEVSSSHVLKKHIVRFDGFDLDIKYKWSVWTDCSSCGVVGKMFKYGNCMATVKHGQAKEHRDHKRFRRISANNVTNVLHKKYEDVKHIVNKKKKFNSKSTSIINFRNVSWVTYLIEKFKTGIPCASPTLPDQVLEKIQSFKSVKVVTKYCVDPCQESEVFEILDPEGNAIEVANNTAGIYSVFQTLPQLPPEIERKSLEGDCGTDIIIQCPSSLLTTVPFTWKINKKTVFPKVIANESHNRITIDYVQRITIKKLKHKDEHIYSCWQRDKLAGTVNLHVNKKLKIRLNHHFTLLGILLLIGIFLIFGMKLINRELRSSK